MEEKSLVKTEKGIFSKITSFFRNIFKANKVVNNEDSNVGNKEIMNEENISGNLQNLVEEELSEEIKEKLEEQKIEELMAKIGNNKDELRKLDINTLRNINKYYNKKVEVLTLEIAKLKSDFSTN